MLPTHELLDSRNGSAIYLRRPGFEFTPVTLRKIASFLCTGSDGSVRVFAFSYSMLDFVDAAALPDEELLAQALEVVRVVMDRGAAEPIREQTYEFAKGTYADVENPPWWIPVG